MARGKLSDDTLVLAGAGLLALVVLAGSGKAKKGRACSPIRAPRSTRGFPGRVAFIPAHQDNYGGQRPTSAITTSCLANPVEMSRMRSVSFSLTPGQYAAR